MADLYHIFIRPAPPKVATYGYSAVSRQQEIEKVLDTHLDWFRYFENLYVVYSSSTQHLLSLQLTPFVQSGGSLFICKIDPTSTQGWMSPKFWDWLSKHR